VEMVCCRLRIQTRPLLVASIVVSLLSLLLLSVPMLKYRETVLKIMGRPAPVDVEVPEKDVLPPAGSIFDPNGSISHAMAQPRFSEMNQTLLLEDLKGLLPRIALPGQGERLKTKYLFPVLPLSLRGQFHALRETMVVARFLNRTLVVPSLVDIQTEGADNGVSGLVTTATGGVFDVTLMETYLPVETSKVFDKITRMVRLAPTTACVKDEKAVRVLSKLPLRQTAIEMIPRDSPLPNPELSLLTEERLARIVEEFTKDYVANAAISCFAGNVLVGGAPPKGTDAFSQALARETVLATAALQFTPQIRALAQRILGKEGRLLAISLVSDSHRMIPCPTAPAPKSAGYCFKNQAGGVHFLNLSCLRDLANTHGKKKGFTRTYVAVQEDAGDAVDPSLLEKHLGPLGPLLGWNSIQKEVNAFRERNDPTAPVGNLLRVVVEEELSISATLFFFLPSTDRSEFARRARISRMGEATQTLELGTNTCFSAQF